MGDGGNQVCWLRCVAKVERLEDAQGTFVSGEKGSAGGRTLGKSKVRDGRQEELMELEAMWKRNEESLKKEGVTRRADQACGSRR